ncbi:MAG: O-antigen ligase family protein [Spirulina sp.]
MRNLILDPFFLFFISLNFFVYFTFFSLKINKGSKARKIDLIAIPTFLFLTTNSKLEPFSFLNPINLSARDKSLSITLLQLGVYAITIFLIRSQYKDILSNLFSIYLLPFVGIFLFVNNISWAWSQTPLHTFRSSLVLAGTAAVAMHISKKLSWDELMMVLLLNSSITVLISIFVAVLLPSLGTGDKGWTGVLYHPIDFGAFMAFSSTLFFVHSLDAGKNVIPFRLMAIIISMVMLLSNSAGAIVALAVLLGTSCFLSFAKQLNTIQLVIYILVSLMIGIVGALNSDAIFLSVLDFLGKEPNLTGRADIWPQIWDEIVKKPFLGYGYSGFWQPWRGIDNPASNIMVASTQYIPPHAHNGFLEIFLDTGLIGFILFAASLVLVFYRSIKLFIKTRSKVFLVPVIFVIYVILLNLNQSSLLSPNYIWVYYVIFSAKIAMEYPLLSAQR